MSRFLEFIFANNDFLLFIFCIPLLLEFSEFEFLSIVGQIDNLSYADGAVFLLKASDTIRIVSRCFGQIDLFEKRRPIRP